ncbi:MAG: hypothetical protein D6719_06935 [Candidatus Dadabacteria bacterium]|nr:MAG: hypothetical protein D6719_06935 [Candidatus Dadabacteria bacterium]
MQILSKEDRNFEDYVTVLKQAKMVGRYWKEGEVQLVYAANRYVLVVRPGPQPESNPEKIAIKPSRSFSESEQIARQILSREAERGSDVHFEAGYRDR